MKNPKIYLLLLLLFFLNFSFFYPGFTVGDSISEEWICTWTGDITARAYALAIDSSNNVYLTGSSDGDMCLVKYSTSGVQLWNCTWDGYDGEICNAIALDSSDNVYLAGYTSGFGNGLTDMCLVKYNSSGVQQWNRTWGRNYLDVAYGVTLDSLNNVYIVGFTQTYGGGEGSGTVLAKYNTAGVLQWNRTWDFCYCRRIAIDSSDNIYLVGETSYDLSLIKCDTSGVIQWNRSWNGGFSSYGNGVALDSLDNIYVVGFTRKFGEDLKLCLLKYTNSGIRQWNKTYGKYSYGLSNGIALDSSKNIYITTLSYLLKFNNSGGLLWNHTCCESVEFMSVGVSLDSLENIYIAGYKLRTGGKGYEMILVKISNPSMTAIP